jgi:hypothetical protein
MEKYVPAKHWYLLTGLHGGETQNNIVIFIQVQILLSEILGTRHVSEIGIFRISEW